HLALVRSVYHAINDHNAGAYFTLTGREPIANGRLITRPSAENFPPFGAVLATLRPSGRPLPDFVQTPDWMSNLGSFLPGQDAGAAPSATGAPTRPASKAPGPAPPRELTPARAGRRRSLLAAVARTLGDGVEADGLDAHYRKAFSLISSPEARRAFDLSREPE